MSVLIAVEIRQTPSNGTEIQNDFPQTSFLTETDSLGVVTGTPEVATSIPGLPDLSTVGQSEGGTTQSAPNTIAPSNTSPSIGQLITETDAQGSAFTSIFGESTLSTSSGNGISSISTTGTSSSASSTASSSPSNHSSSAPIGAIVGGVLGGLAIIGVIIVAVVYILRRHPRSKPETRNTTIEDQPPRYPGQDMHEMPNSVFVPRELDGTQILEMEGRPNK